MSRSAAIFLLTVLLAGCHKEQPVSMREAARVPLDYIKPTPVAISSLKVGEIKPTCKFRMLADGRAFLSRIDEPDDSGECVEVRRGADWYALLLPYKLRQAWAADADVSSKGYWEPVVRVEIVGGPISERLP